MMKKNYLLSILLVLGMGLFAQTVTKVTKTISPFVNTFPVVLQDNVSGGYHQVADEAGRDALPSGLKQTGMLVWVQATHAAYQWDGAAWRQVQLVRNWEEGSSFYIGDVFLYQNKLVFAKAAGTIAAGANPLNDTTNWGSTLGDNLASGQILVGDVNGVAQAVTMTGDALLDNTGKLTITSVPLSGDLTLDAAGAATISDGKVTSAKILNADIATEDFADGAVTIAKMSSAGITDKDKVLTTNTSGAPQWEDRTNFASSLLTAGNILVGDAQGKAADVPMSGDVRINDAGVTNIFPGIIDDADVSSSAAILGTKIAPDFGSQAVITTGNVTGNKIIVGQTNAVTLQTPATLAASYALTLPDATGTAGQALITDATGKLSWGTAMTAGTVEGNTLRWNNTTTKWEESTVLKNDGTDVTVSGNLSVATGKNLQIGTPTVNHITVDGDDMTVAGDAEIDGNVWIDGTLSTPSDQRLKTNIATLAGVLDKLDNMRGVSYQFIDQAKYAKGPQVGVIAQELQKVFPELVTQGADGFLAVNYTQLSAVLLQAVKEQQARIEKLEKQMSLVLKRLGME